MLDKQGARGLRINIDVFLGRSGFCLLEAGRTSVSSSKDDAHSKEGKKKEVGFGLRYVDFWFSEAAESGDSGSMTISKKKSIPVVCVLRMDCSYDGQKNDRDVQE